MLNILPFNSNFDINYINNLDMFLKIKIDIVITLILVFFFLTLTYFYFFNLTSIMLISEAAMLTAILVLPVAIGNFFPSLTSDILNLLNASAMEAVVGVVVIFIFHKSWKLRNMGKLQILEANLLINLNYNFTFFDNTDNILKAKIEISLILIIIFFFLTLLYWFFFNLTSIMLISEAAMVTAILILPVSIGNFFPSLTSDILNLLNASAMEAVVGVVVIFIFHKSWKVRNIGKLQILESGFLFKITQKSWYPVFIILTYLFNFYNLLRLSLIIKWIIKKLLIFIVHIVKIKFLIAIIIVLVFICISILNLPNLNENLEMTFNYTTRLLHNTDQQLNLNQKFNKYWVIDTLQKKTIIKQSEYNLRLYSNNQQKIKLNSETVFRGLYEFNRNISKIPILNNVNSNFIDNVGMLNNLENFTNFFDNRFENIDLNSKFILKNKILKYSIFEENWLNLLFENIKISNLLNIDKIPPIVEFLNTSNLNKQSNLISYLGSSQDSKLNEMFKFKTNTTKSFKNNKQNNDKNLINYTIGNYFKKQKNNVNNVDLVNPWLIKENINNSGWNLENQTIANWNVTKNHINYLKKYPIGLNNEIVKKITIKPLISNFGIIINNINTNIKNYDNYTNWYLYFNKLKNDTNNFLVGNTSIITFWPENKNNIKKYTNFKTGHTIFKNNSNLNSLLKTTVSWANSIRIYKTNGNVNNYIKNILLKKNNELYIKKPKQNFSWSEKNSEYLFNTKINPWLEQSSVENEILDYSYNINLTSNYESSEWFKINKNKIQKNINFKKKKNFKNNFNFPEHLELFNLINNNNNNLNKKTKQIIDSNYIGFDFYVELENKLDKLTKKIIENSISHNISLKRSLLPFSLGNPKSINVYGVDTLNTQIIGLTYNKAANRRGLSKLSNYVENKNNNNIKFQNIFDIKNYKKNDVSLNRKFSFLNNKVNNYNINNYFSTLFENSVNKQISKRLVEVSSYINPSDENVKSMYINEIGLDYKYAFDYEINDYEEYFTNNYKYLTNLENSIIDKNEKIVQNKIQLNSNFESKQMNRQNMGMEKIIKDFEDNVSTINEIENNVPNHDDDYSLENEDVINDENMWNFLKKNKKNVKINLFDDGSINKTKTFSKYNKKQRKYEILNNKKVVNARMLQPFIELIKQRNYTISKDLGRMNTEWPLGGKFKKLVNTFGNVKKQKLLKINTFSNGLMPKLTNNFAKITNFEDLEIPDSKIRLSGYKPHTLYGYLWDEFLKQSYNLNLKFFNFNYNFKIKNLKNTNIFNNQSHLNYKNNIEKQLEPDYRYKFTLNDEIGNTIIKKMFTKVGYVPEILYPNYNNLKVNNNKNLTISSEIEILLKNLGKKKKKLNKFLRKKIKYGETPLGMRYSGIEHKLKLPYLKKKQWIRNSIEYKKFKIESDKNNLLNFNQNLNKLGESSLTRLVNLTDTDNFEYLNKEMELFDLYIDNEKFYDTNLENKYKFSYQQRVDNRIDNSDIDWNKYILVHTIDNWHVQADHKLRKKRNMRLYKKLNMYGNDSIVSLGTHKYQNNIKYSDFIFKKNMYNLRKNKKYGDYQFLQNRLINYEQSDYKYSEKLYKNNLILLNKKRKIFKKHQNDGNMLEADILTTIKKNMYDKNYFDNYFVNYSNLVNRNNIQLTSAITNKKYTGNFKINWIPINLIDNYSIILDDYYYGLNRELNSRLIENKNYINNNNITENGTKLNLINNATKYNYIENSIKLSNIGTFNTKNYITQMRLKSNTINFNNQIFLKKYIKKNNYNIKSYKLKYKSLFIIFKKINFLIKSRIVSENIINIKNTINKFINKSKKTYIIYINKEYINIFRNEITLMQQFNFKFNNLLCVKQIKIIKIYNNSIMSIINFLLKFLKITIKWIIKKNKNVTNF